ncbi:MAG: hypothetical protein RIF39_15295, partial [Cyclobacteriaceae bacterium]
MDRNSLKLDLFEKIFVRVEHAKEESDTAYFLSLLYAGEQLTKITELGLLAGLQDDTERKKYSILYHLVRADGIGEWSSYLEEILTGPSSHLLILEAKRICKDLIQKVERNSWQYKAVALLHSSLIEIGEDIEDLPVKVQGKTWFSMFARLRNKTRGHGALPSKFYQSISRHLEQSIKLIINNFQLFDLEWAYLFQSLSGKYRVVKVSKTTNSYDYLKTKEALKEHHENGIYIYLNSPLKIDLVETDVDLSDYLFPNGNFGTKRYDVLSYISGNKDSKDNSKFLVPPSN